MMHFLRVAADNPTAMSSGLRVSGLFGSSLRFVTSSPFVLVKDYENSWVVFHRLEISKLRDGLFLVYVWAGKGMEEKTGKEIWMIRTLWTEMIFSHMKRVGIGQKSFDWD